ATIFPTLEELGIGVTAYGVLSRGLLSGSKPAAAGDFRAHLPRFTGENRERNERLVAALEKLAVEKGTRPAQLAIAWVLAKGKSIVPVLGALDVDLSPADLAQIEEAIPASQVAGARYDPHQMRVLDSEK